MSRAKKISSGVYQIGEYRIVRESGPYTFPAHWGIYRGDKWVAAAKSLYDAKDEIEYREGRGKE